MRVAILLSVAALLSTAAPSRAATTLTPEQLRSDFRIAQQALEALHPGLRRHGEPRFAEFEKELHGEMTVREAYLFFSRMTASLRCGHTYCNFLNQSDAVRREVFDGADKVPFTFRLAGSKMIVTSCACDLKRGTEITAINGVPVTRMLSRLLTVVKADGSNDAKRRYDLQLTGTGEYEPFDVYQPLLFPPQNGRYRLSTSAGTITVPAIARAARGITPPTEDEQWQLRFLDAHTAHLRLGTFVTWKMKMDWKAFLTDAFAQMEQRGSRNLILDLRGNEGGSDDVVRELLEYVRWKLIHIDARRELVRYRTVPPDLAPHLTTWDPSFKDRGDTVEEAEGGFYRLKRTSGAAADLDKSPKAFKGRIYLLVDAANSSATFFLASVMKTNGLATLVGQTTGGSRRGTNGGQMFFLKLPASGIEIDVPLIGYYPTTPEPDAGIEPDVAVKPSARDIQRGIDTELEATRALIRKKSAR